MGRAKTERSAMEMDKEQYETEIRRFRERVQSAKSHVNFHEESKKEELEKDASESAPSCD